MRKYLSRGIALLLSVVMLFGAGFGTVASAAQTEPAPKQTMEMHRDKDGNTWATPKTVEAEEEAAPAKQPVRKSEPVKAKPAVKTETKKVNTSAKKAQTVTSVARQPAKQAIRQEGEEFFGFETFEDLKQIAAMDLPEHAYICFEGTEPLVIAESMTFPKPVNLDWAEADVVVPEGVTFCANAEGSTLWTKSLTVAGTVKGFQVGATEKLDITGEVAVSATMDIDFDTVVSGLGNVTYVEEWAVLRYTIWIEGEDWAKDLDTALDGLKKANTVGPNAMLDIYWDTNGDIVLTESMEIPENCAFHVDRLNRNEGLSFTVAQGATMANNSNFSVEGDLYINGTLINNGWLGTDDHRNGSKIVFGDGSSYEGGGAMFAYGTTDDPAQAIVGLDLSQFEVYCNENGDIYNFELYPNYGGGGGSGGDDNRYTFSDFEELKAMAADPDAYQDTWYYDGAGTFTFKENIELPDWATLEFTGEEFTIPAGVEVSGAHLFYVSDCLVEGTLLVDVFHVDDGKMEVTGTVNTYEWITVDETGELLLKGQASCDYIEVYGSLNITGKLSADEVYIYSNGAEFAGDFTGKENIELTQEWGRISYNTGVTTLDELKAFYAKADQSDDSREHFGAGWCLEESVVLKESLTVPANAYLDVSCDTDETLTVAENVTLTVDGDLYLYTDLYVKGTLENNGYLSVDSISGGRLFMEEGSSYTGRGFLAANTEADSLSTAISGLDMNDFKIEKDDWGDSYYWTLTCIAGLTKLATPTDLRWGYTVEWSWDEDSQTPTVTVVKGVPGEVLWKNERPSQNEIDIEFYRVAENRDEYISGISTSSGSGYEVQYDSVDWFTTEDLESGDYYFTVTSKGDGTQYADSDPAVSEIWHYVKPDKKMGDCTKPVFDWPEAKWTGPENQEMYLAEWFFADTKDEEPGIFLGSYAYEEPVDWLSDDFIKSQGIGYYYVRVRALSPNVEEYCNGDWSEMSDPYYLSELAPEVSDTLDEILGDDTLSTEEKVGAVQDMDNAELKSAMIKDDNVVDMIAQLEEEAGGAAAVEVTDSAKDFDQSKVSVVGANLNNAANAAEDIKLVVDKPEKDHVIPEVFHNSVAVSFSMNLENVKDPHDLEVPVEITLPIPATLNPEFLLILHYDVDGNYEQIEPHISYRGNQYYASFVVSGFSDFMMLSQGDGRKGDLNGDGSVNDDDVILLLWHTLLPDMYTIEGDADFNADGSVNDEDVIYLLWHTLLPDMYPL